MSRAESDEGLGQACVVRDQAVTNNWVGIVAGHVRFMQQSRTMMRTTNREAFFIDPDVAEMADWVAARFDDSSGWTHAWVDRKSGRHWSCNGLRDAFLQYRWNGEAWAVNKTKLDAFRRELRAAVQTEDVRSVVTICENILKWGGLAAHNVRYLHQRQPVLVRELQHLHDLLSRNCMPSKCDLRREPGNPATACRMNAGFVKIYSLLCDDCVIYDGRVGAALGLLTRQFLRGDEPNGSTLNAGVRLWHAEGGTKHEKRQGAQPESRHPAVSRDCDRDARLHTVQVMRANWFIRRGLDRNPNAFSAGEDGLHELAGRVVHGRLRPTGRVMAAVLPWERIRSESCRPTPPCIEPSSSGCGSTSRRLRRRSLR